MSRRGLVLAAAVLPLQFLEEGSHLVVAVIVVSVTPGEDGDQVPVFVLAVLGVCGAGGIGVEYILGNQGELGEDRAMPSIQKRQ